MKHDRGVIHVLIEHFAHHLYPRALGMEKRLDAGECLTDYEIDHVAAVLDDARQLRTLIDRHPEHQELASGVIALYANLARRACLNEAANKDGKAGT